MTTDFVVDINDSDDIVTARRAGHELANRLGFSLTDVPIIATAISEIARNITSYAGRGKLRVGVQRGLGLGLPGARRLMDRPQMESELGRGTVLEMWKWIPDSV